MKSGKSFAVLIVILLVGLMLPQIISLIRGPAETPAVFSDAYTLEEAMRLGRDQNKPVLVVATADWCAPCQALKRGALVDPEVVGLIRERSIPVYLEDSRNPDEIHRLGVRVFPTTMILEGDEIVAQIEGGGTPRRYAEMLRSQLPPAN